MWKRQGSTMLLGEMPWLDGMVKSQHISAKLSFLRRPVEEFDIVDPKKLISNKDWFPCKLIKISY